MPRQTWLTGPASSSSGAHGFLFIINYYFATDTFSQDTCGGCICAPLPGRAVPDVARNL